MARSEVPEPVLCSLRNTRCAREVKYNSKRTSGKTTTDSDVTAPRKNVLPEKLIVLGTRCNVGSSQTMNGAAPLSRDIKEIAVPTAGEELGER